jgi:MraZ protein
LAFHGTFEHSLDAKNRLTVPAKFRNDLSEGTFVVRGEDSSLRIYPFNDYTAIVDAAVAGMNPLSQKARETRRLFFAFADDVPLDGAGRITLTARQLQHAGIAGREVVIAGTGDALELWSPEKWNSYEQDLMTRAPELTGSLDSSP